MRKLYHYTVTQYLKNIIDCGYIKLATAGIPANEKPAVFCSYHNHWEPTCNKLRKTANGYEPMTFEELVLLGIARIEVNETAAPYNVYEYKRLSGINKKNWNHLINLASESKSNIQDYRVNFEPIYSKDWIKIEIYDTEINEWKTFIEYNNTTP